MQAVSFTRMADGTFDEYQFLAGLEHQEVEGTAARVLTELTRQADRPAGYQIDRLRRLRRGGPETLCLRADLPGDPPSRCLSGLLLFSPYRRRPEPARAPPRPPAFRGLYRVLREMGPDLFRPGLRHHAARRLPADGRAHLRARTLRGGAGVGRCAMGVSVLRNRPMLTMLQCW